MDTVENKTMIMDVFPKDFDGMGIKTIAVLGLPQALCAMRNPKESWDKSDSYYDTSEPGLIHIGENDWKLTKMLFNGGTPHDKHLRMVHVYANFNMPRYFWSEFDTYKFNTKVSDSTMHKLLNNDNPITEKMFVYCNEDTNLINSIINQLETLRKQFKQIQKNYIGSDKAGKLDHLLLRAKRILPEGFLQMRTVDTNYSELRNMYYWRKNHRLKEEWQDVFCGWVKTLPYAKELIIGE